MKKYFAVCILFLLLFSISAFAGEADVVDVVVKKSGEKTFDLDVTVLHEDTGWDHYANRWEVVDENGAILATRILHHPHVNEQPFTRSLSGVPIPENNNMVIIRAHDLVHEFGGKTISVNFP